MKKLFITLIVFSIIITGLPVYADTTTSCVRVGNTIRCNTQQDFQTKLNALKSQYGITDFFTCYDKGNIAYRDTSSPSAQQSVYSYMQYCLETMAMKKAPDPTIDKAVGMLGGNSNAPQNSSDTCSDSAKYPNGAVWSNGRCVDYDTACKESNGPDSYYSYKDSNGKIFCRTIIKIAPTPVPASPVTVKQKQKATLKSDVKKNEIIAPTDQVKSDSSLTKQTEPSHESAPSKEPEQSLFRKIINFFKNLFR